MEMGELIGVGGFGEVRRAIWKGTDVAVKMLSRDHITKDMKNKFIEEVSTLHRLAPREFV